MGALSKLTGDPIYESVALRALHKLWSMRSSLNLFGTTLDVETGEWIEFSSGIGAGRPPELAYPLSVSSWDFPIYQLRAVVHMLEIVDCLLQLTHGFDLCYSDVLTVKLMSRP